VLESPSRSNLKFNVFEEILFLVGIDVNKFKIYASVINDLVDSRNHIAHGQYLKVDKPTFDLIYGDVLLIMESFKTEIENSAIQKKYIERRIIPVTNA